MKLAIVTNILPPYRVPLFNYLAQQPGIDLRVFLCAATEPNRHWEWPTGICFEYEIGSTWTWSSKRGKTIYINPGLIGRIRHFAPDVVVAGGMGLVSVMAWLGARLCGARLLLWAEGVVGAGGWIGRIMRPLRLCLVHVTDGYIASSQTAAELFRCLGARRERITISLITLDVNAFGQAVSKQRENREQLRQMLGLAGPTVLYVGRLEPSKGVDLLLEAFDQLTATIPVAELVIVGTGTELDGLEARVTAAHRAQTHFVGFKQANELPPYYAAADLFALFSRVEPFGLVVTEAIAAGLPAICSRFAGAAHDLVEHGQNGFIIDPEDIETNVRLMTQILTDNSLRERMGRRSLEIARKCTVEEAGAAMLAAVEAALGRC